MSLARVASRARPCLQVRAARQRRLASDHAVDHHHGHAVDNTVYPAEGFSTRAVLYFFGLSALAVGFYKFAPAPGEDAWITQKLKGAITPLDVWQNLTDKHLKLSHEQAEEILLAQEAQAPKVHRMRYPSAFDQHSPHGRPVGTSVNFKEMSIKRE